MTLRYIWELFRQYIDGLMHDCSNSSALAVELLQSCTKSSILSEYRMVKRVIQPTREPHDTATYTEKNMIARGILAYNTAACNMQHTCIA